MELRKGKDLETFSFFLGEIVNSSCDTEGAKVIFRLLISFRSLVLELAWRFHLGRTGFAREAPLQAKCSYGR